MERTKTKLLEPTVLLIVQACLPARGAPYAHTVLPACFWELRVGKAAGRSPGELELTQRVRRKTWPCWIVQPWESSLPYLPFPLISPNDCSFQSRWKLADHTKKAKILILTHMGLWLGAGLQKRDIKRWRSGDYPATQLLPTP